MPVPVMEIPVRACSLAFVAHLVRRHAMGLVLQGSSHNITGIPESRLRRPPVKAPARAERGGTPAASIEAHHDNPGSGPIADDFFARFDVAVIDQDFSRLFRAVQALKRDGVRNFRRYLAESEDRARDLAGKVRVNNANAAALRMLGATSLAGIVRQLANIVDIAEAIFLGVAGIKRSEYLVTDGTPIPIVYSLRIPRTEEEARRVPIVIMDLSHLRLAEAARQATLAKSQFLSSLKDEIRIPLNVMIGNIELLALTNVDDEQFELINDADKSAKLLLGLIGNIFDFSRIEAGKFTPEMGDVNPTALVEEAVDVLQSLAREKHIFITASFHPDLPDLVRGDAMCLRQILLNLIGNAVKFTDRGGVQVNLVVTQVEEAVCALRFEVHDSGRGFDQVMAPRLFEPFSQQGGQGDRAGGAGIGLSICKRLVEGGGGIIGCDAVPGEGASFWFIMPAAIVRRAAPPIRADLTGVRVAIIAGADDQAGPGADYFTTRGAGVIIESGRSFLDFARNPAAAGAPCADIAVLVAADRPDDASEAVGRLREQRIVPVLYGAGLSARAGLRQGFAMIISPETAPALLDRNIRLLIGDSPARSRLVERHRAFFQETGPALAGARVLVLEDRLVEGTVIRKQLVKLGIDCEVAANSTLGLEALDRRGFDMVLCDGSPFATEGDDFTRRLRRREAEAGNGSRVPVIALTARGRADSQKSLMAGMDDVIGNPVTIERLAATLIRWLPPPAAAAPTAAMDGAGGLQIDLPRLADTLGTDEPDLLNRVMAEFLAAVGASLSDVESAVATGDPASIRAAAHGAQGEADGAAATALADLYGELDRAAEDGDRITARRLVARAAIEVGRIEDFIRNRLADQPF
jgi:signal transduction histidine kinase/HPt (histidine-containing phosphotransfer) domain-containing protein